MLLTSRLTLAILCASAAAPSACAQKPINLTARELFYAPVSQNTPSKPNPHRPSSHVSAAKTTSPSKLADKPSDAGSPIVEASYSAQRPLGLRYGFLRKDAADEYAEVNSDTVFHAGDRIRFSVQTNDPAYLYIVMRGSSGTWKVLFPTSEIEGGFNLVQAGHSYVFPPPPGRFAFDEQQGEEKICLVVTRRPEENLEQLIYTLGVGAPPAQPVTKKTSRPTLLAENHPIDDGVVNRLRSGAYTRDLVFETVDETTPGEKKEKATYVVNSNAAPDARLVVDLTLKHE